MMSLVDSFVGYYTGVCMLIILDVLRELVKVTNSVTQVNYSNKEYPV